MAEILEFEDLRKKSKDHRFRVLRDHPTWSEYEQYWRDKKDNMRGVYGDRYLRGELSEIQAAEERGYWKGVFAVLRGRD